MGQIKAVSMNLSVSVDSSCDLYRRIVSGGVLVGRVQIWKAKEEQRKDI